MQFSVDVKMEDIITELKFAGSYGEVIEFVKALDEKIADSEFTDRLIEALKPAVSEYRYIVFIYNSAKTKEFNDYEAAYDYVVEECWRLTPIGPWEIKRLNKDA